MTKIIHGKNPFFKEGSLSSTIVEIGTVLTQVLKSSLLIMDEKRPSIRLHELLPDPRSLVEHLGVVRSVKLEKDTKRYLFVITDLHDISRTKLECRIDPVSLEAGEFKVYYRLIILKSDNDSYQRIKGNDFVKITPLNASFHCLCSTKIYVDGGVIELQHQQSGEAIASYDFERIGEEESVPY